MRGREGERERRKREGESLGNTLLLTNLANFLYSAPYTHTCTRDLPNALMDVPYTHTLADLVTNNTFPTAFIVPHSQSLSLPPPPCASGTRVDMHACSGGGDGGVAHVAISWRAV